MSVIYKKLEMTRVRREGRRIVYELTEDDAGQNFLVENLLLEDASLWNVVSIGYKRDEKKQVFEVVVEYAMVGEPDHEPYVDVFIAMADGEKERA